MRPRRGVLGSRLVLVAGWLVVIGVAFGLGYALAQHDATVAAARIQALQDESARLSEDLAATKEAHIRLERAHLMDREARRVAQGQLADLQQERLQLAKRVAYLGRLIGDGGRGAVDIKTVELTAGETPRTYRYRLTLSQLAPDVGRSTGRVILSVVLRRDGQDVVEPVSALPGSSGGAQDMDFEHFQVLEGVIQIPEGAVPRRLMVKVEPQGDRLVETSDAFDWEVRPVAEVPSPDLATPSRRDGDALE